MQEIAVCLPSGKILVVPYGTRINQIIKDEEFSTITESIVAAMVNNELVSLSFKVEVNASFQPVTIDSPQGIGIYRRSLAFLLAMAVESLFPERRLVIGHSLGDGYFYYFEGTSETDPKEVSRIDQKMREIIEADMPILRQVLSYCNAVQHIEQTNQTGTSLLLKYRNESKIPVYVCGSYLDIAHAPLVDRTGVLTTFDLMPYQMGFLLRYPAKMVPCVLEPFVDNKLLFSVYTEYKAWGKILGVSCVGSLNELIEKKEIGEFVKTAEALHDKKIAEIADRIFERREDVRVVLIAGPSSSGKTPFTKKLAIQLRVLGFNPLTISLDDYFLPREQTPRDEEGNYDFEALEAIDVPLLNDHLIKLFEGKEVEIPLFDFIAGGGRKRDTGCS
jgi:uridine kinase